VEELLRPAGTASSLRLSGEKPHHQLHGMAYDFDLTHKGRLCVRNLYNTNTCVHTSLHTELYQFKGHLEPPEVPGEFYLFFNGEFNCSRQIAASIVYL